MLTSSFAEPRPRLIVVSHERSGTHFLMNGMMKAYRYISYPWIDFDYFKTDINFYHPESIVRFFDQFRSVNLANIVKSHHQFEFFKEAIERIIDDFTILYIYRDPRDVMRSMFRFLNETEWVEGPKVSSPSELIRAQPMGYMMRYQMKQSLNMLRRWSDHVDGWRRAVEKYPEAIIPVRYEDLDTRYSETITDIGRKLGMDPISFLRPRKDRNVIAPGETKRYEWDSDDYRLFRRYAGEMMDTCGYAGPEQL